MSAATVTQLVQHPPPTTPQSATRHLTLVPAPEPSPAEALLAALTEGDPAAWHQVVTRYRGLLHHVTLQLGLRAEQRDDVLQVTWLRLLEHAGEIRRPEGLGSWLVTTAVREATRLLRQSSREQPTETLPEPVDDDAHLAERVHLALAAARLHTAMRNLPDRERLLLEQLIAPEQPSYTQISRRLQMPIGAIGPVRQRAMRRLAPMLEGCWAE